MNSIDPRCFAANSINTISISGGKDSLAQWLRAIENDVPHISVFADMRYQSESATDGACTGQH